MSTELLFFAVLVVLGIILLVSAIKFKRLSSRLDPKSDASGFCDFYQLCPFDRK